MGPQPLQGRQQYSITVTTITTTITRETAVQPYSSPQSPQPLQGRQQYSQIVHHNHHNHYKGDSSTAIQFTTITTTITRETAHVLCADTTQHPPPNTQHPPPNTHHPTPNT